MAADESKSILQSKTGWVGIVLAAALEFHPGLNAWVMTHPDTVILIYTVAMFAMRRISTGAVHFFVRKKENVIGSNIGSVG